MAPMTTITTLIGIVDNTDTAIANQANALTNAFNPLGISISATDDAGLVSPAQSTSGRPQYGHSGKRVN